MRPCDHAALSSPVALARLLAVVAVVASGSKTLRTMVIVCSAPRDNAQSGNHHQQVGSSLASEFEVRKALILVLLRAWGEEELTFVGLEGRGDT